MIDPRNILPCLLAVDYSDSFGRQAKRKVNPHIIILWFFIFKIICILYEVAIHFQLFFKIYHSYTLRFIWLAFESDLWKGTCLGILIWHKILFNCPSRLTQKCENYKIDFFHLQKVLNGSAVEQWSKISVLKFFC